MVASPRKWGMCLLTLSGHVDSNTTGSSLFAGLADVEEIIMPSVFLTSDTHFGHLGVCKFMREDGVTKLRPWDSPEEMDEEMVKRWNDTVRPNDKVYHLGDVVINRKALKIMHRLNGDKVLIKGNHDIFRLEEYTPFFRDIRGSHVMNGLILTHIPVHPDNLYRFGTNIHGHLHSNRIMVKDHGRFIIDPRYYSVCVEQTDFKPVLFEDVCKGIIEQGGTVGFRQGNGSRTAM
jgi:calcineurin-like phosphoesterase family protein